MSDFEATRRLITAALSRGKHFPFTLCSKHYIAIARVKDRADEFICIELTDEKAMRAIALLGLGAGRDDISVTRVMPMTPQIEVEGGYITCAALVAIGVFALREVQNAYRGKTDVLRILAELSEGRGEQLAVTAYQLTDIIVTSARQAGVFGGEESYQDLMAFGKKYKPRPWELWRRNARLFQSARRACRPGELDGMMFYAKAVISQGVLEHVAKDLHQKLQGPHAT